MHNKLTYWRQQSQLYGLHSSSKSELNLKVLEIDKRFLESTLREQSHSQSHGGWIGKCPYCAISDKTKKKQAYLTPRETGYVFHCCACEITQTTFHFLALGSQR